MATATQTIQRPSQPTRTYDYLYDPVFAVSSEHDHAKETFKAQTNISRIRCVPQFKTMFSSLRHFPRQSVQLDNTDPVPRHVYRHWRGYADQARETLVRYKKFNYDPSVVVPPKHFEPVDVEGKDHYRFFRRPVIPFIPSGPPGVVLSTSQHMDSMASSTDQIKSKLSLAAPSTRTVFVQTDYRDSEAQTDPYSPEYIVRPGSQPEILTIATMCYGNGLPAGLAEVEMIERARLKRAWEATLPPLTDMSELDKRRHMMEEQERKEWEFRESEIESLHKERIELLKQLLKQREVDHQALNDKRLEHLWSKKQRDKERKVRHIRSEHVKAIRKLTEQRRHVEKRKEKRNIISEYTNFSSQVYAPMTRIGVFLDAESEQYHVKSQYTSTLEGLLELEATLPLSVTELSSRPPSQHAKPVNSKARLEAKLGKMLDQVYADLKKDDTPILRTPRLLQRVEKPIPRPPTPTIEAPDQVIEEQERAVILLQRVIRGRAIQTKMHEGKEMRSHLIRELRTTHALQSPEQKQKKKEAETIHAKQRALVRQQHKEEVIYDGVEGPAADVVGRQLDFLNKELHRIQEERRVHAFVMLAERQRRMREAEESGLRQREERIRRTEDEIFKQMMRVHHGTVDSYLEDVIMQSLEKTADEQARLEIQQQAEKINTLAMEFEQKRTELESKEMVAEMVHGFLLPEVEKKSLRLKVRQSQRKHLLAAHRIVYDELQQTAAVANILRRPSKNSTSSHPPQDSTSSQPPQDSTSSQPPQDSTSSQPPQDSTSSQPPQDSTSSQPPQDSTSSQPPQDSTSSQPPQDSTSSQPPQDSTSSQPPQDSTSSQPPQDSTSTQPPQDSTSSQPPQDSTSSQPPQDSTSTQLPQDSTSSQPPQDSTSTVPQDSTSTQPPQDSTSTVPQDSTSSQPPQDSTSTQPPQDSTGSQPPQASTSTQLPQDSTSSHPPQDSTSTVPQDSTSTQPPQDSTSTVPQDSTSSQPPQDSTSTQPPQDSTSSHPPQDNAFVDEQSSS